MLSLITYLVVYASIHLAVCSSTEDGRKDQKRYRLNYLIYYTFITMMSCCCWNTIVWETDEEGFDSVFDSLDASENTSSVKDLLVGQVSFLLHSRTYHGVELNDSSDKSNNNLHHLGRYPVNPLKIIIHGWMTNASAEWVKAMTSAYLKRPRINVIVVNWGNLAGDTRYFPSLHKALPVGKRVGKFIDAIVSQGYARPLDIHIIGHSLGAHAAGIAGHAFSGTVGRITGLEPSKPGYELADDDEMLTKDDAEMVDIIHTTAGTLGQFKPNGHVDFYPNGGANQPGCDGYSPEVNSYLESVSCSHLRVCEFFTESIINYNAFSSDKCPDDVSIPPKKEDCDDGIQTFMGENCPITTRGIYYLDTNDKSPYSKRR